jgi:hypothetical protein
MPYQKQSKRAMNHGRFLPRFKNSTSVWSRLGAQPRSDDIYDLEGGAFHIGASHTLIIWLHVLSSGRGKTGSNSRGIFHHQIYIYELTDGFSLFPGGSFGTTPGGAGPQNRVRACLCVADHREVVGGSYSTVPCSPAVERRDLWHLGCVPEGISPPVAGRLDFYFSSPCFSLATGGLGEASLCCIPSLYCYGCLLCCSLLAASPCAICALASGPTEPFLSSLAGAPVVSFFYPTPTCSGD